MSVLQWSNLRAIEPDAALPRVAKDKQEDDYYTDRRPLNRGGGSDALEDRKDEE